MRKKLMGVTAGLAVTALATAGTVTAASASGKDRARDTSAKQQVIQQMLEAGLQVAPKHRTLPTVKTNEGRVNAANPYLGLIPDISTVDWSYWRTIAAQRSTNTGFSEGAKPFIHRERENAGTYGQNDTLADLERIRGFGIGGSRNPGVRVLGQLSPPHIPTADIQTAEDQGSIPSATPTAIGGNRDGVEVATRIGDGPHGSNGTGSGDFDFYRVSLVRGETVNASTLGSRLDTLAFVYSADGEILAANDDADGTYQSKVSYTVPSTGVYYVMIAGFAFNAGVPQDPFDSASGVGYGAEGPYDLSITVGPSDTDVYGVHLRAGDVLGGSIRGSATDIKVTKFNGRERIGSTQDLSYIYPAETPLPGGGNGVMAYVAEREGWYAVSTGSGDGPYHLRLETYRPGSETTRPKTVQKVFLDFNGERLNTGIFGGKGVSRLSPISDFLADWNLPARAENRVIDQVVATVRENIQNDLRRSGLNKDFRVQLLNSRDDADQFGRPNVSRVVVGGTIRESGVSTIGIAQSIDPGNYGHEETALVLLDVLSSSEADGFGDASLNYYVRPRSDKVDFIGTAVGNVTSHEIGHFIGSFHVQQFNQKHDLMDQGGNFPMLYGVGPDNVGGTGDDVDVDFGIDEYNPNEGLTGRENTYNNSLWAFVRGQGQ